MENFQSSLHSTPAPEKPRGITKQTLVIAVVLSLVLGTVGGGLAGSLVSNGTFDQWLNRTSVATDATGTATTVQVEEESATIEVVNKVQNSVVSIVGTQDLSKVTTAYPDDFFNNFFGMPTQPQTGSREVSSGSGFIVTADGFVMTNKHVIDGTNTDYTVLTNDGKKYAAKIIASDPTNDLAILKIEAKDLQPVSFGDSSKLQIGQTVIAIGNALGQFRNTVTKGVISGLSRRITAGDGQSAETLEDVIQTDAAINRGNSGGPLLDITGRVIGVNTAVSQDGQLIGFAITGNQAKQVFESVQKDGKIIRPYLGVRYIPVTKALQEQNKLTVDYGVLVLRGESSADLAVIPGSPADKAGIVENDIILEMDGTKLNAEHSLAGQIQKKKPGDVVSLKVLSKGKEKTVQATLEESK
ncbi:MAG: trypsin-like peptidase domain-containing protein [Patescibacteria group bacterium]|jgi:serine protease Do